MADAVSFRARARTVDHLGREQIADCPTAISELWKNAYDAYARTVGLHIYDGPVPMAAIVDDGHGMSRDDFIDKWLVVGTESKAGEDLVSDVHRNGLALRPKQGQKGIGRLSSAFLGPLLLVVSKRRDHPFTASMIDWRLFENPFLYLQDIEIPVVEFAAKEQVFDQLSDMFDTLMGNLWGKSRDPARDERIVEAWRRFDVLETQQGRPSTRESIEGVVLDAIIEPRHFRQWPLWKGDKDHGTLLLIGDIGFDLTAQLEDRTSASDPAVNQAQERLFQTLSNFTDPYADSREIDEGYGAAEFNYSVTVWTGALRRAVISNEREFDLKNLEELEHVVHGQVDEQGVFIGQIKAFGQWLPGDVRIDPKFAVSTRANSRVGPFHLRLGSYQGTLAESSHSAEIHQRIAEKSTKYAGVMVYRNGLRLMPYGREDNDFFEIEKRRSMHAGRSFWSNRRTFGRIAITRDSNPNLKDKAGREGLIDNQATKIFRDLVRNILIVTAQRYFGTDSEYQKQYLPAIQEARARERAEEERKRQRGLKRREFRGELRRLAPELTRTLAELDALAARVRDAPLAQEAEIIPLRAALADIKNRSKEFALGGVPRVLGTLEQEYGEYRRNQRRLAELAAGLEQSLCTALEAAKPRAPREIVYSDLSAHGSFLQSRLRKWLKAAKDLQTAEQQRITSLYEQRSKIYHTRTLPLLDDVEQGRISVTQALAQLAMHREATDQENAEVFEPYISALRSLQENIDLDAVASYSMDAVDELREELERLHALAQLGITVEIIGHEIEGFELAISEGLNELPATVKQTATFAAVKTAHEALADRLRFLSPLKLSGEKLRTHLSGRDIFEYLTRFFGKNLPERSISLEASERFLLFSVYEQPSRIYPVFINLVNNAIYWVQQPRAARRRILLDAQDQQVIVADEGPGVDMDDVKRLFTLFFTRKVRGGRGVGLYLCRANLAAGGHTISYVTDGPHHVLPGANFVIKFTGAEYG